MSAPRKMISRFEDIVFNIGYVFSFVVLSDRYWFYKAAKSLYSSFFGPYVISPEPDYRGAKVVIEGYPHSANSFFVTNLTYRQDAVGPKHRHWSLRGALIARRPLIILVRAPLECARSRYLRSVRRQPSYHSTLFVATGLTTWYLYYRYVWKRRDQLHILPFTVLTGQYQSVRAWIQRVAAVSLAEIPSLEGTNPLNGEYDSIELGWFSRFMLTRAERLYGALLDWSSRDFGSVNAADEAKMLRHGDDIDAANERFERPLGRLRNSCGYIKSGR